MHAAAAARAHYHQPRADRGRLGRPGPSRPLGSSPSGLRHAQQGSDESLWNASAARDAAHVKSME
jgi:hypothetical protein